MLWLALFSPVTLGQVLPVAGPQWRGPWEAGQYTDKPEDESSLKASLWLISGVPWGDSVGCAQSSEGRVSADVARSGFWAVTGQVMEHIL